MPMYPGPVPAGQQHSQAFVATPGLYTSPAPLSGPQQQQPLYQEATRAHDGTPVSAPAGTSSC
jgi:hypothetical protein